MCVGVTREGMDVEDSEKVSAGRQGTGVKTGHRCEEKSKRVCRYIKRDNRRRRLKTPVTKK